MEALQGRAVLYLGNHQVGIESLIFSIVASALQKVPTLTLAKVEHQQSWQLDVVGPALHTPAEVALRDAEDLGAPQVVAVDDGHRRSAGAARAAGLRRVLGGAAHRRP